ncbi:MAG: SDR family NAD(P)-dependent oxidoreductase [Candidatus Coatesbacteria bacterium]
MKTVVVTGCDYGLGVELAKRGLADGWRVFAGCLHPAKAKAMRDPSRAYGKQLTVLPMDMSSEPAIRRAAAVIRRKVPRLDLVVNNAGVFWNDGPEKVSSRDFQRMFAVNTIGPAILVRELLKPLRAARGAIVNISSEAGSLAGVANARPIIAYGASKAALNMVMRRLSFMLADDGIRILLVHPGWMRTPMGRTAGDPTQEPAATAKDVFELAAKLDDRMTGSFVEHSGRPYPW